ncbi:MAG: hypothetical protein IPL40_03820 [Proteobacteria bacterium]|nr:hypothetical protein [Pseudomonadota bacterium]
MRSSARLRRLLPVLGSMLLTIACGDGKKPFKPVVLPDGFGLRDASIYLDGRTSDLGANPDLRVSLEGPEITIQTPEEAQIIVGDLLKVLVKVTDPDGVEAQSLRLTLQGSQPVALGLTTTPDVYEALLDMRKIVGKGRLWVEATDLLGNANSQVRLFERDPGPIVLFLAPSEGARFPRSVSVQLVVADRVEVTAFETRIGTQPLTLATTASTADRTVYVGQVQFDDPMFPVPLSGQQVLTASATNANGARTIVKRTFFVDDEGPSISIRSQQAGQLIGRVIDLAAEVSDPAGVQAASVRCVIGNELQKREVTLEPDPTNPAIYRGQFDTRNLTLQMLWPVLSFRAVDRLGNESHREIEVALDDRQPILSLDPAEDFRALREKDDTIQCSLPFDPVGRDAADDLDAVPQVTELRARIEDRGNGVPGAQIVPIGTVDPATVRLFVLPGAVGKPIVVDTDGDGFCDAINPAVVPLGSRPDPGQAVAVDLAPIPGSGIADFTPHLNPPLPTGLGCVNGDEAKSPRSLCDTTPASMSSIITYSTKLPAIWTIPPVRPSDDDYCVGIGFDFRANEIPAGWACIAAEARDELGNLGVSRPIRVAVEYGTSRFLPGPAPATAGAAPNCTGTLDAATGKVTAQPCAFREWDLDFAQEFQPALETRFFR